MQEYLSSEEALKEAEFLKAIAEERTRKGLSKDSNTAEFDFLSEKVDSVRKDNPLLYEQALGLLELSKEAERVQPAIRETFLQIATDAASIGLREAYSRIDEIKSYVEQQTTLGRDPETALKEKKKEVVDVALRTQFDQFRQILANSPMLRNASAAELQILERYHLGSEIEALHKRVIAERLDRMLERAP